MLCSRQSSSLHSGCDSRTIAAPLHLLVLPLHPQLVLSGTAVRHSLGVLSPPLTSEHLRCVTTTTPSEHVESGSHNFLPYQTTKGVARRRMMLSPFSIATPIPTYHIRMNISPRDTTNTEFTFRVPPPPEMALNFPQRGSPPRLKKRCRAVADIDGEHSCLHKKKRRLRLFLITSRLSPQFSHPATNIVDRGNSKIAVWAKQKSLGRNLLRKAAILNRIRRHAIQARETREGLGRVLVEQEREQEQLQLAKLEFVHGSTDTYTRAGLHRISASLPATACMIRDGYNGVASSPPRSRSGSPSPPLRALGERTPSEYRSPNDAYSYSQPSRSKSPRRSHIPLPPSPLGLSNYDAFDLEDDIPGPYAHLDDEFETDRDEEDAREDTAFHFATTSATCPPITRTCSSATPKTSPQAIRSDFSMLDPDEPVFGGYAQVAEGAGAIWPPMSTSDAEDVSKALPLSSSPDLPAIFTTAHTTVSLSPNFTPAMFDATLPAATSMSPNFAPSLADPGFLPTASSPSSPPAPNMAKDGQALTEHAIPRAAIRLNQNEREQERERQRKYMFMQLG